jgi:hypothetical protein
VIALAANTVVAATKLSPARLEQAYAILSEASGIDEVLTVYAVHVGAREAILAAKVHPSPGQMGADLACLLDELDRQLRDALPEIGEMFIDVTSHRRTPEHDPYRQQTCKMAETRASST